VTQKFSELTPEYLVINNNTTGWLTVWWTINMERPASSHIDITACWEFSDTGCWNCEWTDKVHSV